MQTLLIDRVPFPRHETKGDYNETSFAIAFLCTLSLLADRDRDGTIVGSSVHKQQQPHVRGCLRFDYVKRQVFEVMMVSSDTFIKLNSGLLIPKLRGLEWIMRR